MQETQSKIAVDQTELQFAKQIETYKLIELKIKEAIQKIGNANRYQVILIIYLVFCFILATFLLIGTSYFFMNPNFICNGVAATEEEACKLSMDSCQLVNSYTITAYSELYCGEKTVERNLIQAMLGVGACLGVLFINFVSDYKGRKFSFIVSLATGIFSIILLIIGAYSKTTTAWFYLSEIFAGFCGNSLLTLVYVMSDHLMSKKYSSQCILITNAFFGVGEIAFILFTGPLNWEDLSILFMLIPSFGLLGMAFFLIIQDPVFLFTKKRYEDCKKSLEIMALFNKTQSKLEQAYEIIEDIKKHHVEMHYDCKETSPQNQSKLKYLHLLLKKEIMVPIILIGIFNFGGNLVYYILSYAISNTGSSFGTEIVLFGIVEFVGIFPMMAVGEKTPRKLGLLAITSVNIIFGLVFLFNISTVMQTIVIVAIRFMLTSTYMLYIFLVVETFPQHIQATCFGIVEFLSQLGKFFAPFMITFAEAISISPVLLAGFIMIVMQVTPLLPLKETLVKKKDVVEKGESLLETQTE